MVQIFYSIFELRYTEKALLYCFVPIYRELYYVLSRPIFLFSYIPTINSRTQHNKTAGRFIVKSKSFIRKRLHSKKKVYKKFSIYFFIFLFLYSNSTILVGKLNYLGSNWNASAHRSGLYFCFFFRFLPPSTNFVWLNYRNVFYFDNDGKNSSNRLIKSC